jgi:hypothetical protein
MNILSRFRRGTPIALLFLAVTGANASDLVVESYGSDNNVAVEQAANNAAHLRVIGDRNSTALYQLGTRGTVEVDVFADDSSIDIVTGPCAGGLATVPIRTFGGRKIIIGRCG